MKSITLVSIGLLTAVTAIGVTGYLAWKSLSGEGGLSSFAAEPIAQSQLASVVPLPLAESIVSVATSANSTPAPLQPATTPAYSQAENDYLFDLSQALQPVERDRLSAADQLRVGQMIVSWLASGADYWTVRQQFDTAFQSSITGNYPHNRDVYIKFATQHLGPSYQATLTPPTENSDPYRLVEMPVPYGMPVPYAMPEAGIYPEPMPMLPFPEAHLYSPYPEADPIPPDFYPQPDYPAPYQIPTSPNQVPQPYPRTPDQAPYQTPYQRPNSAPQPNSNDSGIPGAIEISDRPNSQFY